MQSYRELTVWTKSMDLAEEVYRITKHLPGQERYALSDQLRRAAISIPSNIAEGYGRNAFREYIRFLSIARGSNNEVQTQLLLCVRLNFLKDSDIIPAMELSDEISRMLNSLIHKLHSAFPG